MDALELYFVETGSALAFLLIISGFGITNSPWYGQLMKKETTWKFCKSN
jgi:hypothetical protein